MTGVSRRGWTVAATLIAITVFLAGLTAQQSSSCTCKDIPFLLNLLSRDLAVLDKIQQFRTTLRITAQMTDPVPGSTPRISYSQLFNSEMTQAMVLATNAQLPNGTCIVYNDLRVPGEPSLAKVLEQFYDTFKPHSEEVLRVLNAMPSSCRLGDWFGSITVVETLTEKGSQHIPAKNTYEAQFDKGTDESFERTQTRLGTIQIGGTFEDPTSNWQVSEKITKKSVHLQMVGCEVGKQTLTARMGTTTETFSQSGSAFKTGQLDVNIYEDDRGRLNLSFWLPEIEQTGPYDKSDTIAGGCPNEKAGNPEHSTINDTMSKIQAEGIRAPISLSKPRMATGSTTLTLPAPGVNGAHTITVTCHLYQLR